MGEENMRRITIFLTIGGLFFSGCGEINPKLKRIRDENIFCSGSCELEMSRAEYWINKHSKLKIQRVTKNTIETYNPYQGKQYGFMVMKEPIGSNQYKINVNVSTYAPILEDISPKDTKKALIHYIKTGEDLATGFNGITSSIR
jgi:hypothetical protein